MADRVTSYPAITERVLASDNLIDRLMGNDARLGTLLSALAARVPFETWERHGWHLTPNDPSSPVPDTRSLPDSLWAGQSQLPGIDMRDEEQVGLLRRLAADHRADYDALPRTADGIGGYFLDNGAFESVDAEIYYGLVRHHKPALIVEIGAGWSTLLAARALAANEADGRSGQVRAVTECPADFVRRAAAADPRIELDVTPLRHLPLDTFHRLAEGDILFVDSSHVLAIGSDVQYEVLELLPRLAPGVLVHVHDIFLPHEYPRDWVLGPEHRFWNEQYLLQAFLAFNRGYEVAWAGSWMHARHPDLLEASIASYDRTTRRPGSLWIRRVADNERLPVMEPLVRPASGIPALGRSE